MKGINIFVSNKIRMHPIEFTPDGLGMAGRPVILLDLGVSDEVFLEAIHKTFATSKTGVPSRPVSKAEEKAYREAMDIRSQRDLGAGADITFEHGSYTVTPINKKGLFGKSIVVDEHNLLESVRECLGLLHARAD